MSLDSSTFYLVAALMAATLGCMLHYVGVQQKLLPLRWCGSAYLLGALAIALWTVSKPVLGEVALIFNAFAFIACGMVWTAARMFLGHPPRWLGLFLGGVIWLVVVLFLPRELVTFRLTIGALIIAIYAALTTRALSTERRKARPGRWRSFVMPVMHGLIIMLPVLLLNFLSGDGAGPVSSFWVMLFAIELVFYAIGTAFLTFVLITEHNVNVYKAAAHRDELTGLLNRSGLSAAASQVIPRETRSGRSVSVMIFDVDHFTRINDDYSRMAGDDILKVLAAVLNGTLRTSDVSARIGGDEFAALLPCSLGDAQIVAERARRAFETCGLAIDGTPVDASVSVGVASGFVGADLDRLLAAAADALDRARKNGGNCVETSNVLETPREDRERERAIENASRERPVVTASRYARVSAQAKPA